MPFKVGDHVKYLNEKGGGVIRNILPNGKAEVEDEHGFLFELEFSEIVSEHKSALNEKSIQDKLRQFDSHGMSSIAIHEAGHKNFHQIVKNSITQNRGGKRKSPDLVEIDLHLDALVQNARSMNDGQKLMLQLEHARHCLEAAQELKMNHLVFIHGVGAGVLRHELRKWLMALGTVSFENADYQTYGIGATQVRLHGLFGE